MCRPTSVQWKIRTNNVFTAPAVPENWRAWWNHTSMEPDQDSLMQIKE